MASRMKVIAGFFVRSMLAFLSALGFRDQLDTPPTATLKKEKVVYVCACRKTKSCPCMSEAKAAGRCACGTEGGSPMKAVPMDGDWAKENRDALANGLQAKRIAEFFGPCHSGLGVSAA